MIINQLSCVVGIVVAYILSCNRISRKRDFALFVVAFANMIVSGFITGTIDLAGKNVNWKEIIWSLIITVVGFAVIFLFNWVFKPFARGKLNKKIMAFTEKANPNLDLKIMAGDLTFFGEVNEMESNLQIKQLIEKKFKSIRIIAKSPLIEPEKARIGKLLHLLNESAVNIKFYSDDSFPDLRLRFRCITLGENSTATINIFKFVAEKEYTTEELCSTSSDRQQIKRNQAFISLWEMYWKALSENQEIIQQCKNAYQLYVHN